MQMTKFYGKQATTDVFRAAEQTRELNSDPPTALPPGRILQSI